MLASEREREGEGVEGLFVVFPCEHVSERLCSPTTRIMSKLHVGLWQV